jgi:Kelch motif protein/galactose oxidase-like protein
MSRSAWFALLVCVCSSAHAEAREHSRDRWVEIAPPARAEHVCVYDAPHRRLIIFGGQADGGLRNDVWVLSLSGRSSRFRGDREHDDRAGMEHGAQSSDREAHHHLDHPSWERIEPAGETPSPRSGAAAVYDSARDRLLIFGGRDTSDRALDDLWELSLHGRGDRATWRHVATDGPRPRGRYRATLTLDPEEGGLILYGGEPWYGWKLSDVWVLSLSDLRWRSVTPAGDPPVGRSAHSAVYCPDLHGILIFGGESYGVPGCSYCVGSRENAEILLLRIGEQPTWSSLAGTSAEGPCEMQGHFAAWDEAGHRMLVFGGGNFWRACAVSYATVWSLSVPGLAWSQLGPAQPWPRPRSFAVAFFDPASRNLYVHGGEGSVGGGACYADAWRLALDPEPTWTLLEPERVTPQFLTTWQLPAIYQPRRDRILVDGGDQIWAYDIEDAAWSSIATSGTAPPVHFNNSAVLDTKRDRLVVYGGALLPSPPHYGYVPFDEVWTLSLGERATWTRLSTAGQAPTAGTGAAIYDPVRDRLLVYASGVWALPFGVAGALQWQQISSPSDTVHVRTPRAQRAVVAYDSRRDRMVVFGGGSSTPIDLEVYTVNSCAALDLNGPPVWNPLSPDPRNPALPTPRAAASGIYDAARDRLIVVGGFEHSVFVSHIPDDAWALALNSDKWIRLRMETDPHPDWFNPTAVYDSRRDRTLVLQNDIVWALESGAERWHHGPREDAVAFQGPESGPAVLDLLGAVPNPSAGAMMIRFALPDASPASLELLDIAGRRLWSEDVGVLGGGSHIVQVGSARTLAPGLYLLRLNRGPVSVTRKVVRLGRFER